MISNLNDIYIMFGLKYNINPLWLKSLAIVESNENIYAININKKSYYFKSKQEAHNHLKSLSHSDQIDIGLFQITKHWFNKIDIDLKEGFNAYTNTEIACILLKDIFKRKGHKFSSLPYFHNPTFNSNYYNHLKSVYNKLKSQPQLIGAN